MAVSFFVASSVSLISQCDASGGKCDIAVGDGPTTTTFSGTGGYVTNNNTNTISLINTGTNAVAKTITVGSGPIATVVSGTGVYVVNQNSATVSVIDTRTNTVTKTVSVGTDAYYIGISGTGAYVPNYSDNTISVIDTRTNTNVKTVNVGVHPLFVTSSGTGVYVVNSGGASVSVIDRRTNTVSRTVTVGTSPRSAGVSGTGVYIVNEGSTNVSVIDSRTNTVAKTISIGATALYVVFNGTGAYVPNYTSGTVSVIDTIRNINVKNITMGTNPTALATSGTGVYVINETDKTISVIDVRTNTIVKTVNVGTTPYSIAISAGEAFVANAGSDTVSVIDVATNTAISQCTAVCGNGEIGNGEVCDDGNSTNGDGCSNVCTVEATWSCTGEPSVCTQACSDSITAGAAAARHYGHACYAFYNATTLSFTNAEAACETHNGTLAMVKSAAIQTLTSAIGSYAWIGLSDTATEGTFIWVDGSSLSYTNWDPSQPNGGTGENCVFKENGNLWHDYPCGDAHQYFCQIQDVVASVTTDSPLVQASGGRRASTIGALIIQGAQRFLGTSSSVSSVAALQSPSKSPSRSSDYIFSDVQSDDWFGPSVKQMVEEHIFSGYKDAAGKSLDRFGPADPITFGQLAKVATQFAGRPITPEAKTDRSFASIDDAKKMQLSFLQTKDTNAPVPRGQVLLTLLDALHIPLQESAVHYKDVPAGSAYQKAIATATALGIVSGDTDTSGKPTGLFRPNATMNRAEVAKLLFALKAHPVSVVAKPQTISSTTRTVGSSTLHLRSDSRMDANVLQTLKKGQTLTVLRTVYGTWAQVRLASGQEGYVWANYLK